MEDCLNRTRKVKGKRIHVFASMAPAIVSPKYFSKVSSYSWRLNTEGFVVTNLKTKTTQTKNTSLYLSHLICGVSDSDTQRVHYINEDRLDCRCENLVVLTPSICGGTANLSKANTSGFKGVSWSKAANKWVALIHINKKKISLGVFRDKVAAAKAYDAAAIKYFGSTAKTNACMGLLNGC